MSFAKQLNILDYALQGLWRRRLKTGGIVVIFSAVIFLAASFQFTIKALNNLVDQDLRATPEIVIQKMSAGRQESIPLNYIKKLKGIWGIRRVVPRIWGYYFDATTKANYTVIGLNYSKMPMGGLLDKALIKGSHLPGPGEALIGTGVKEVLRLPDKGAMLSLFRPDYSLKALKVSGVFMPSTDILTTDTILMNLPDSRDLFAIKPGLVTDLCVYVANPREVTTIARKIAARLPDTRVVPKSQIKETYREVFGWRGGFASICLLTAIAAFIIFAWDKASGMNPDEKREVAILKVIGWQTADILSLRFYEGFIVSSLSFLLGCTLAYAHVAFMGAGLFRPILTGWSVIQPRIMLRPALEFSDILLIFSLVVPPYMAATIVPAWRSAIIPPDAAVN
ncbi:MAG TPA: FtsX-like permease family protein [Desulfobacterales bacterium]|nr:FtsX-like permease family protein [Desulfobacterales bacterium]